MAWIAASTSRIERRGRLVEHEDRRVLQHDAGDGDALALAARELDAALADMGVVARAAALVLQSRDELVRLAAVRRLDQLRLAGVGAAEQDIVADRAVQQRRVLGDHADLRRAAISCVTVGDVLAVDQDAAALDVVEAQQQVDEGRLAGAGAADEADLLARRGSSSVRSSITPCSRP